MRQPKLATKVDKTIGQTIRRLRLLKRMTQEKLGDALGVGFQQIQKYENGINRVGSGRLYNIAEILDVPVMVLFAAGDTRKRSAAKGLRPSPYELLDDPTTLRMLDEFSKIGDTKTRHAVLAVIRCAARSK
jgi:transcriptional regulator with XRE-family HTH domain